MKPAAYSRLLDQLRTLTVSPTNGIMQFGIVPQEHHF
jgi:hypothetical protein